MSLMVLLIIGLLVFAVLDFVLVDYKKLSKSLYNLAFFYAFLVVALKYYYGPDIALYVPLYENIESPIKLIAGNYDYDDYFEFGYLLFTSICHSFGLSFWAMTFIVSCFYFLAIRLLFKHIEKYKCFALLLLFVFDINLALHQYRQCLAVSAFIFAILAYNNKKYFLMCILLLITSQMHKSGVFFVALFGIAVLCENFIRKTHYNYILLFISLIALLIIPIESVVTLLQDSNLFSKSVIESIKHHFILNDKIQIMLILNIVILFGLVMYHEYRKDDEIKSLYWLSFFFLAIVFAFYQSVFLLPRLRSYLLPFGIVYMINLFQNNTGIKGIKFYNYFLVCLLLFISFNTAKGLYIEGNKSVSGINEISTVFRLKNETRSEIRYKQLKKASVAWKSETVDKAVNKQKQIE